MNNFGRRLRALRETRGMTQRQLAELSMVSIRAIRDLESGRVSKPQRHTVRLLAEGLRLPAAERVRLDSLTGHAGPWTEQEPEVAPELSPPPSPLDGLIGRSRETTLLRELLSSGEERLIGLTGLAGVGKTRLAQEVANDAARESKAGRGTVVLWRGTAETQSPGPVPGDPAGTVRDRVRLGLDALCGIGEPDMEELRRLIGRWPTLIVLDGQDLVRTAVGRLVELVGNCPGLRVLYTARRPAEVPGELVVAIRPLDVPEDGASPGPGTAGSSGRSHGSGGWTEISSVRLLSRHIRRYRPDFRPDRTSSAAVAAVCRGLDGIPRAIQVAAPYFLAHEPETMLRRLPSLVGDVLVEGGIDLEGAVRRLGHEEAALLDHMSLGNRWWSVGEVAEAVGMPLSAGARAAHSLLARGLVTSGTSVLGTRFRVLETVRAHRTGRIHGEAAEKSAASSAGGTAAVRRFSA
ncbi:helix-turn-helix domain-containing protein [Streptomyces millisiae]|uniref:Helix-turn-helix domain-containing protein n=1 Tax=Streptomyces millisiae TaxID=3075542 RepID=A0ABU2LN81_9ACTN|nr:helix-turn-helix domain-containing protein [Streptomyces sp. DSM 44918]MDT0319039.1 helix-turn-helix domain-containing protein [Streptomyces sp. DSM 44918]